MADRGTLERLTIKAYEAADYSGSPIATFEAYVNPNEITLGYEIEYDAAQGAGTTGSRMNFKAMKPGDLSLTFFVDGTGANGRAIDAAARRAFRPPPATTARFTAQLPEGGVGDDPGERCLKSASIAIRCSSRRQACAPSSPPLR